MISQDVQFWLNMIDWESVSHINNCRPFYIWGAYSKGLAVCEEFSNRGLHVSGFIDMYKETQEYGGKPVFRPELILSRAPKAYIIIAIESIRTEINGLLKSYSFLRDIDYLYFPELVPDIELSSFWGRYEDIYHNSFSFYGSSPLQNVRIKCKAGNNTISIGENFICRNGAVTIIASYGSNITIGANFFCEGSIIIRADVGGTITIGNGFTAEDGSIINATYNGSILIQDKVSTGKRMYISSGKNSPVTIGTDCMFSHDVSIHGSNKHSIIDFENRKVISTESEKPIEIGKHVWLGKNASILYGSIIGEGSIVGACSLVKGIYPSKTILAGNIAKIIRQNCSWDRRKDIDYSEY